MTCDNNATNKELLEKADKEWEELWKDNPPKYEGKIRIGGDEKGFSISSSISIAMYPYIIEALQKNEPEAFAAAMLDMKIKKIAENSCFFNELAKTFDDDSEEADGDDAEDDSDSESEDGEKDNTPEAE